VAITTKQENTAGPVYNARLKLKLNLPELAQKYTNNALGTLVDVM